MGGFMGCCRMKSVFCVFRHIADRTVRPYAGVVVGRFQWYFAVKFNYGFTTAREIKYTSQHCCDKTGPVTRRSAGGRNPP